MTLGQKIKKLRTDRNLSQADFAKSIGINQSTISYIEKSSKIHMVTLRKISDKYKVKMNELLSDTKMNEVDTLKSEIAYLLKQNKLLEQMVELLKKQK